VPDGHHDCLWQRTKPTRRAMSARAGSHRSSRGRGARAGRGTITTRRTTLTTDERQPATQADIRAKTSTPTAVQARWPRAEAARRAGPSGHQGGAHQCSHVETRALSGRNREDCQETGPAPWDPHSQALAESRCALKAIAQPKARSLVRQNRIQGKAALGLRGTSLGIVRTAANRKVCCARAKGRLHL
jgi:hypothetical protein